MEGLYGHTLVMIFSSERADLLLLRVESGIKILI